MNLQKEWNAFFRKNRLIILLGYPEQMSDILLNMTFVDSVEAEYKAKIIIGEYKGKAVYIYHDYFSGNPRIYYRRRIVYGENLDYIARAKVHRLLEKFYGNCPARTISFNELDDLEFFIHIGLRGDEWEIEKDCEIKKKLFYKKQKKKTFKKIKQV